MEEYVMEVDIKRAARILKVVDGTGFWLLLPLFYLMLSYTDSGKLMMSMYVWGNTDQINVWLKYLLAAGLSSVLYYGIRGVFGLSLRFLFPTISAAMRQHKPGFSEVISRTNSYGFLAWLVVAVMFAVVLGASIGICVLFEYLGPYSGWGYFAWSFYVFGIAALMYCEPAPEFQTKQT